MIILTPARFVMALDKVKAGETPLRPEPDMSSHSNNFANFSFISAISEKSNNIIIYINSRTTTIQFLWFEKKIK